MFGLSVLIALIPSKWILLIVALGYFFFRWATAKRDYFEKRGIPFNSPEFFFGNIKGLVLQTETFHNSILKLYNSWPKSKILGFFEMRNPIFMLRDPDLIKQVTVKDFDHFLDHRTAIDETSDSLFGRGLNMLRGSEWKDMRATLSPAFTGSKMRTMFQLVVDCAEKLRNDLLEQSKTNEPLVKEMKDIFSRFATDVIATCAFGVEVNSQKDRDNKFFLMGSTITNFAGIRSLIFFGYTQFPKIMKFFDVTLFPKSTYKFFRSLVMDSMKYRDQHNIVRPDMINLLMQVRKGNLVHEKENQPEQGFSVVEESEVGLALHKREWKDDDLTAQCLLFFLAGFDTISTLLSFASYELAIEKDIQKKLVEEVDHYREQLGGKPLTYEMLGEMIYLDMVLSETLRKWPPALITDRKCTKPYELKYDGKSLKMNPGDLFWIPIYGIHRDPKYYENPEKFDPERFSDENKHKIQPNTFIPFGVGPRNCIGSRFALMESKAIMFYLLSSFTFEVSDKTSIPLKLVKGGFQVRAENGFWIHLKPRK